MKTKKNKNQRSEGANAKEGGDHFKDKWIA